METDTTSLKPARPPPQPRLSPPLKWHGGKHYLASRIVALMPPHLHYVEPFAGGLAVVLARDPDDPASSLPPHKGVSESVNYLHLPLTIFLPAPSSTATSP